MKTLPSFLAIGLIVPAAAFAQGSGSQAQTSVSYLFGAPADTPLFNTTTGATSTSSITADVSYNGFQNAYAQANLAAGTLRVRSGGTADNINAGASAQFGDTFGALDAATRQAYAWQTSDTVNFSFSVTGAVQSTLSAADMDTLDDGFTSRVWFNFYAYKPGFFERQARLTALYQGTWSDAAATEANRLSAEIDSLQIARNFTRLGREYSPHYDASNAPYVEFNADTPTVISASFAPGGSFEWFAALDVSTRFAADTPLGYRPSFVIDFSHTIGASFAGPAGTVTTSASGLFPSTVSAVPEPGTWAMLLAGGLLLSAHQRRAAKRG